jgi:preprotein translocase subunit SecG
MDILILFGLIFVAVFLILVVLVQRGRGGGLAGALGGMGGQSAFGTKAGDTFTKITIWTADVWILLCIAGVKYLSTMHIQYGSGSSSTPAGVGPAAGAPAEKSPATRAPAENPPPNPAPKKK